MVNGATWVAWATWLVALVTGERWSAGASPLLRTLVLTAITFFGMKAVVLAGRDGPRLPAARRLLFLVWPGMNPRLFVRSRSSDPARARQLARRALRNAVIGLALIGSARVVGHPAAAPVLMVGLSLLVHFGVFTGLAAALLAAGFPVRVLFDAPWRARTPDEFWTRRWNRGFAEMTSVAVQRPLAERWGRRRALLGSFLVSGLLHEAAISLPVGAGFGLPTLYFGLQGLFALRLGSHPSRLRTLLAIVVPLPLVFHPWWVQGVFVPLVVG